MGGHGETAEGSGDGLATRDIAKNEELTDNYFLHEDDEGFVFDCTCGASNCRFQNEGASSTLFFALPPSEQEKMLDYTSAVVRANWLRKNGKGKPIDWTLPTCHRDASTRTRLVFPGPSGVSCGEAVAVKQISTDDISSSNEYGLVTTKRVAKGDVVFEFWREDWPVLDNDGTPLPLDLVFAAPESPDDPPEGTVVANLHPSRAYRHEDGTPQFSGWEMLMQHSQSNPNVVYNDTDEDNWDNYRGVYALRDLEEGEVLTMDFDCFLWEGGFQDNLTAEQRDERKFWNWMREPTSKATGEALSPYVRNRWKETESDCLE